MYDTNVWLNSADQFIQMSLDFVQVAIVAGHSGPASAGLQLELCGIVGVEAPPVVLGSRICLVVRCDGVASRWSGTHGQAGSGNKGPGRSRGNYSR